MALRGVLDGFYPDLMHGWAIDGDHPDAPAAIVLEVNGQRAARFPCDIPRQDLAEEGIGTGQHGFRFDPRPFLVPGVNHCRVLFDGTDAPLRNGAHMLIAPISADAPGTPVLDPAVAWNEAAHIPRFYRATATPGLPTPRGVHVLGLFNSGTNYLARLLAANGVHGLSQADHERQSKHLPLGIHERLRPLISEDGRQTILYAVSARDPFRWVDAMRARRYEAEFAAITGPLAMPRMSGPPTGRHREPAGLDLAEWGAFFTARNLVDYWNRYHADWIERGVATMGHAAVLRYEDVVTEPCEMVRLARALLGLPPLETVAVNVGSAKPEHGVPGDFWLAKRKVLMPEFAPRFTRDELAFITRELSPDVCHHLGYEPDYENRPELLGE